MAVRVGKLNYNQGKVVGRGSSGIYVFRGFLGLHENDRPVAVKRTQRGPNLDESLIQPEVELMKKANDHPNILRYIRQESDSNFLFIVTELCSGTLEDYFNTTYQGPRFLSDWEILGLKHLHELEIVHRDIKPTNILIGTDGTKPIIKLADFSVSKVLKTDRHDFTNTDVENPKGTKGWMAPEVYEFARFDFKVDIWALGCIFGYTLTKGNKHPFGEDPDKRVVSMKDKKEMLLVKEDLKEPYSKDDVTIKLIQSMLTLDSSRRPTIKWIKKNTFFLFDPERTSMFFELCNSFKDSVTDDKIAHFTELVKNKTVGIHAVTQDEWTPLLLSLCQYCKQDSLIDLLHLLLKRASHINAKTQSYGTTPLHLLCEYGIKRDLLELVHKLLIDKGVDANTKMKNGKTPLHLLCENYENNNLIDIVQLLIENGADANAKDVNEETALYLLCFNYKHNNLIDIVQLLIENGADTNVKSKSFRTEDYTPLHALCRNKSNNSAQSAVNVARLFIEKGADVNAKGKYGITPLHLLCQVGSHGKLTDIVQLLIEKGADINALIRAEVNHQFFKEGYTPLNMLFDSGASDNSVDVARLLIEKGANFSSNYVAKSTPLHVLMCQHNKSDTLIDIVNNID